MPIKISILKAIPLYNGIEEKLILDYKKSTPRIVALGNTLLSM